MARVIDIVCPGCENSWGNVHVPQDDGYYVRQCPACGSAWIDDEYGRIVVFGAVYLDVFTNTVKVG